jgi:hypothetical protein
MVNPSEIDFDDDLVFCVDALIKKARGVSQVLQDFFPLLAVYQKKNEGVMANLTSCLNSYIVFGQGFLEQSAANVAPYTYLFSMAEASMLLPPRKLDGLVIDYSDNLEGCHVLSLALQHLSPQPYIYEKLQFTISAVLDILFNPKEKDNLNSYNYVLQKEQLSLTLRKALYQVIMSALIFDHDFTASLLVKFGMVEKFLGAICDPKVLYRSEYERRLFVFSLTKLLFFMDT